MAGGLVASVRAAQTQTACHNLPCFIAGGVFPGGHGRGGGASTCAFGCAAGAGARADGLRIGPSVAGGLVVSVGAARSNTTCMRNENEYIAVELQPKNVILAISRRFNGHKAVGFMQSPASHFIYSARAFIPAIWIR